LAEHSTHLVESESCLPPCADNMAALDVGKGASMDDDDGRVATWWRPAEPCTCWSFAAASSAGGSGGLARLEAAWGTLELRDERRSGVAMGLSPYGCTRMVAELLLGHQTPWMLPRSIPGVLFHSGGLVGPPWVPKDVHCRVWVIGPHTHRGGGGGPTSGGVPFSIIKSFFRAVFCGIPSSIGAAPTWEPSKPCVIG
jgi:hypothetical protein